jgi:predicted nucleic acid-binding protein
LARAVLEPFSRLGARPYETISELYLVEAPRSYAGTISTRRYDSVRIRRALDRLLATPLRRLSLRPLTPEGWRLQHNFTLADALYIVVAKHLNAPLVTTDRKLAAAPTLPVATITPDHELRSRPTLGWGWAGAFRTSARRRSPPRRR